MPARRRAHVSVRPIAARCAALSGVGVAIHRLWRKRHNP
jgi:hypothetical protein